MGLGWALATLFSVHELDRYIQREHSKLGPELSWASAHYCRLREAPFDVFVQPNNGEMNSQGDWLKYRLAWSDLPQSVAQFCCVPRVARNLLVRRVACRSSCGNQIVRYKCGNIWVKSVNGACVGYIIRKRDFDEEQNTSVTKSKLPSSSMAICGDKPNSPNNSQGHMVGRTSQVGFLLPSICGRIFGTVSYPKPWTNRAEHC